MPESSVVKTPNRTDDSFLKEVRDTFDYYRDRWQDIYDEGATDMRYLSGDPWDPAEKAARKDKLFYGVYDELNQYLNQLINDVRQNKRAIKVIPKGSGSSDKSAELRGDLLRQIEYESRAQAAYETAFEGGASRGYGFAGWRKKYVSDRSFDQELQIRRFPNPDAVLLDYDAKEWDCSDGLGAFVLDLVPQTQYEQKYPKAQITDFSEALINTAPRWFKQSAVQVAEYWKVKLSPRKLLLFDVPKVGPVAIFKDELDQGAERTGHKLLDEREVQERQIKQYITNGVEILEENDWDGKYIPIAPCWGREMWLNEGSGSKRIMLSLVRLARDPYMSYCFLRTNMIIEARMAPKAPFIGYEGQFAHPEEWAAAGVVPIAYLQAKARTDATGDQPLPLPTRPQFQPNFEGYEVACEAMRRAIQASMGKYNASVGKNDSSVTSGTQQKALDAQSDQSSFHFIDNYERFLTCMGRIGDDLIDDTYDTARDIGTRKMDESYHVVRINDPSYTNPTSQKKEHTSLSIGDHGVTISTGPSFDSQREMAMNWAEQLAKMPNIFPLIGDLLTKMQELGPLGDEIAKRLTPPQFQSEDGEPLAPQAAAQIQKLKQAHDKLNAYSQELEAQLKKLQAEKQGKVVDNEYKILMDKLKAEVQIAIAEVNTKAQMLSERTEYINDIWHKIQDQQHEKDMQASEQAHEKDLADKQAQAASQQSAQEASQTAEAQQ
jgi:hypothetical protein